MFHRKKMAGKKLTKIMEQLPLMFRMLRKINYILLMFQNKNSNCEKQVILSMISNEEKL